MEETNLKPHEEFMQEVIDAKSLPAQTQRALAPESDEDISMYINDSQQKKDKDDGSNVSLSGDTKHKRGKDNKDEQMPVDATHLSNSVDNHADNNQDALCENSEEKN